MEAQLIIWLKEYGYIVLFVWSLLEGEIGLVMAGILCHTGDMQYLLSVFVAGLGGFTGDQIYFYVGRFSKGFIQRKLYKQRRKFAIASILLKKFGWPIIFIQRFMYGFRTIIPMAIGITKYSARRYALINLISGWIWAAITITPAYWFGEDILDFLVVVKRYWYFSLPIVAILLFTVYYNFNKFEQQLLKNRHERSVSKK